MFIYLNGGGKRRKKQILTKNSRHDNWNSKKNYVTELKWEIINIRRGLKGPTNDRLKWK